MRKIALLVIIVLLAAVFLGYYFLPATKTTTILNKAQAMEAQPQAALTSDGGQAVSTREISLNYPEFFYSAQKQCPYKR